MFGLPAGSGTQVRRRLGDHDLGLDAEIRPDMHEFSCGEHAPAALAVQLLGRDDHRGDLIQLRHVHRRRRAVYVHAPAAGRSRTCRAWASG